MPDYVYADGEVNADPIELADDETQLEVATGTATQEGVISEAGGSFGFEKIGGGTLTLTADNTYTGRTTITAGTLHVDPASGSVITLSDFTIATGATLSFGASLSFADIGALSGGGDVDLSLDVVLTSYNDVGEDTTFSGSIFDQSGTDPTHWAYFIACGGGLLTLTGDSEFGGFFEVDYEGFVNIDGGSVTSDNTDQSQTIISGTLRVLNGGTLDTTWIQNAGGTLIVDGEGSTATASDWTSITYLLSVENGGVVNSQADAFIGNWVDFPAAATVSGTGSEWNITGLLQIGTDDLSDPFFSQAGSLTIEAGGEVAADEVAIASVGSLHLGDGGLAGELDAETIENAGAIVANFTDAATLDADISGAGTLTKAGGGALTLTGASTYAGATTVAEGRLNVNGSITSATSVEAGGTLGGKGTLGAVTIASGGSLSPGTSTGTITTGSLAFSSGARFAVEIGGTSPGTGYDRATVLGTVSLADATLDLTLLAGFSPTFGNSFTIIANDGTDAVSGRFAGYAEGAIFLLGGRLMSITYQGGDGNDVVIAKTPPPTTIIGTAAADLIDATHTAAGQPLPTSGADLIEGLGGNDRIDALGGDDLVIGDNGRDTINGGAGNDAIAGGKGRDDMRGDGGDDFIKGGDGPDIITGGAGDDTIDGQQKDDLIKGGDGDDWLAGGKGSDKLVGGEGADTFVFRQRKASDKVADFTEVDTIALVKGSFPGIGPKGVLKAKYFYDGPMSPTPKQKILYDEDSGWLLYARRGSDTANPLAFAKIGKHLDDFDRHDILVI